jgi:hypothetical protein
MQAVVVNGTGPPKSLQVVSDHPKPARGPKQVRAVAAVMYLLWGAVARLALSVTHTALDKPQAIPEVLETLAYIISS